MASAIKFLHASDFHLDQPIAGLADIPSHLKSVLANAPFIVGERIFDLAISERVDFVLLAGDIVDLNQGGPRAAAFLLGQFERLADKGIEVYWCGGNVDHPDRWPSAIELPDNVVVFASSLVEQAQQIRGDEVVATLFGSGHESRRRNPSEFRCDPECPFPIALAYGEFDTSSLATQNIRYWALGGMHQRKVIEKPGSVAIYPGTIQSRRPAENGAYGCTLVRVDTEGRIKTQLHELDAVRWSQQKVTVAESAKLDDLKSIIGERCLKLRTESPHTLQLVSWELTTTGDFNPQLRLDDPAGQILEHLRSEFGQASEGVWSVDLRIAPPRSLPTSWYEEETILGDFLRALGRYQGDASIGINLMDYVGETAQEDWLADLCRIPAAAREEMLKQAALIGVEHLGRHEQERAHN